MKKISVLVILFLFVSISSFAAGPATVRAFYGGSGSAFSGGTLTSNLTMSDGTIVELATGASSNLALRFRAFPTTGIFVDSNGDLNLQSKGLPFIRMAGTYLYAGYPLIISTVFANSSVNTQYANNVNIQMDRTASSTRAAYGFSDVGAVIGNSGLNRASPGQPNIIASGTEAMRFTDSGVLIATGSSTNLALRFLGDEDTGFYSPSANQVSISCGGVSPLQITTQSVSIFHPIVHNVASNGYTIYQGNAAYSAAGEANVALPLNIAATSIAFDTGATGYIRAEVSGKNSTDSSCIHVQLNAEYENFGDTLAFIGSPSSTTSQLNAATWSASLSASGDSLSIIATGTPGTIWQVKKLEIGGL